MCNLEIRFIGLVEDFLFPIEINSKHQMTNFKEFSNAKIQYPNQSGIWIFVISACCYLMFVI
jgi:hypothetical protein